MITKDIANYATKTRTNHELIYYYDVRIPFWSIDAIASLKSKEKLTALQEYVLRLINAEVTSGYKICEYLGVERSVLNVAVQVLHENGFVRVFLDDFTLCITESGKAALNTLKYESDTEMEVSLAIDGITGAISFDSIREDNNKKSYVLRAKVEKPDILFFEEKDLNVAFGHSGIAKKYANQKLQSIIEVNNVRLKYKRASVLVFRSKQDDSLDFLVYEDAKEKVEYSKQLGAMILNNEEVCDYMHEWKRYDEINDFVPQKYIDDAKEFDENAIEKAINDINDNLRNEYEDLSEDKIAEFEKDRDSLKYKLEHSTRNIQIFKYEDIVDKALENAKGKVTMVLPFGAALTLKKIRRKMENALKRGIKITVNVAREEDIDSCKKIIKENDNLVIEKSDFGLRVLMQDDEYVVVTEYECVNLHKEQSKWLRIEKSIIYTEAEKVIKNIGKKIVLES